jgi:hypothetical protein
MFAELFAISVHILLFVLHSSDHVNRSFHVHSSYIVRICSSHVFCCLCKSETAIRNGDNDPYQMNLDPTRSMEHTTHVVTINVEATIPALLRLEQILLQCA